jgi:uncharacterized YigZ family protein
MATSTSDFYLTIEQPISAEFKDRGSKFIAFVYPIKSIEDFKIFLQQTKALHPKAAHHCFAYRIGLSNNLFRVSDDGEPSGSAGKPILNAIDSKEITDVLVVVVRYFGGTLLGVPGLVNAYKTTALLALQTTPIVQKPILSIFELQFDYTQTNIVMSIAKQLNATIIENENQLFCIMKIGVQRSKEADLLHRFSEHHTISLKKILTT